MGIVLPRISDAPLNLTTFCRHPQVGRPDMTLRNRHKERRFRVVVFECDNRPVGNGACPLIVDQQVSALMFDGLKRTDRARKLVSFRCVIHSGLDHLAHSADHFCAKQCRRLLESLANPGRRLVLGSYANDFGPVKAHCPNRTR